MGVGVSHHARTTPDEVAVVDGDRRVTYVELDERSTRLAHAFRERGVPDGGRVAIMLPNSLEFFEAGIAASKLDASYVPVNWHLKADELRYILEDSGASLLVSSPELRDAWEGAPCPVLLVGGDYEAAIAAVPSSVESLEASPSATPVFYTSGTTGRPKGVVHGTLDASVMAMAQEGQKALWFWTPDDVYILSGPAYHAGPGGWGGTALYVGATIVVLRTWDAREWLRLVHDERVTKSFMVPAHFIRILEVPPADRATYDLSSLKLICHGGAPCPVDVKRRTIEALAPCEIWELYGASEGGATRISPAEWLARPGSVGLPWPGVEVRVLSAESLEPVPAGEDGLIYVRPAGGAKFHYHADDAKTSSAWHDGAFTVGDIGHLDGDGYLFITDRVSDMVIRGGVNIYPREVEEVLFTHPDVVDCAVFGVPDERSGEALKAVVEVRDGASVTEDQLRAHVRSALADYKVPTHVELVAELPRDPNGKVLKRHLRTAHWEGREARIG